MTRAREELIQQLVGELGRPVRLAPVRAAALGWLAAGTLFVALATLATGPLRAGGASQIASEPSFAIDLLLGLLAGGAAAFGLMRLRIPGLARGARTAAPALLLWAAWAGWQLFELQDRAGPASMLGKREGCVNEVLLFSLVPLAAALFVARRAAPLERGWTGLLAGTAAGVLPAFAMQLACMDDPLHALTLHIAPVLVVGAAGALLGRLVLRRV